MILGIGFLIVVTFLGTSLEALIPRKPTAPVQVAQAGPYQVTLQVSPNPPSINQPANLSLQIVKKASGQLVSNARVILASSMQSMDMGTEEIVARSQSPGLYQAQAHLSMGGSWQLHVQITVPGSPAATTNFDITTQ
ncbi:hypothetical protein KDA_21950 [Dictyobacter alpinus]|uniref:YtkA-like domain-containing protein n=1 Tax=Dictyobacter alpinus TaxID=2014873 RepID=A0A402B5S7_9CHLR|nr:hypothetical protein KDA_21950 [Dictyobacter alpinus]